MTKNKYPNYECGECPIWLGFEGPISEMREMCKKRHCDLLEENEVECDGRCLNCDEFDPVRGCMVEEG
jgi:hypothetical protein